MPRRRYIVRDNVRYEVTPYGWIHCPEARGPKRHACRDCHACQWCAETRCAQCRSRRRARRGRAD